MTQLEHDIAVRILSARLACVAKSALPWTRHEEPSPERMRGGASMAIDKLLAGAEALMLRDMVEESLLGAREVIDLLRTEGIVS